LLNLQIVSLSWKHLKSSRFAPACSPVSSEEQWKIIEHFNTLSQAFFAQSFDADDVGCGAVKVENVSAALDQLRSFSITNHENISNYTKVRLGSHVFQYPCHGPGGPFAVPTGQRLHKVKLGPWARQGDLVQFPNVPSCNPVTVFDKETYTAYSNPSSLRKPELPKDSI